MANGPFPGKCIGKTDCSNPVTVKVRQMCQSCFVVWRRTLETRTCGLEWCDNRYYSKDLCQHHYHVQRTGRPIINPNDPKPTCAGPECDRDAGKSGLCATHYKQRWDGRELTPIRAYLIYEDDSHPGQRLCKTCLQWKDRDEGFYNNSRGGKQTECRPCMIKRSSAHQLEKKLKAQGVNPDEVH